MKWFLVALLMASGLFAQSASQPSVAKNTGVAPKESANHAYFRKAVGTLRPQFENSRQAYIEALDADSNCHKLAEPSKQLYADLPLEALDILLQHDLETLPQICTAPTLLMLYQFRTKARAYYGVVVDLPLVDGCISTYKTTIDKKASDRTERENEKVATCKSRRLYVERIMPDWSIETWGVD